MGKKLTQDEFLRRAHLQHGDLYDYSKTVFRVLSEKVVITCRLHGDFSQRADVHIHGQGCPECAKQARKDTCKLRYGVELPVCSVESLKKSADAIQCKYGVDNVFQLDFVKDKIKNTNLLRRGVENSMQDPEVVAKVQATNIVRYGVPCSMQNELVKERHRLSVYKHYGVYNSMQAPEVKAKAIDSCLLRYGVDNPRKSSEIDAKIKSTCRHKYGVDYVVQAPSVRYKSDKSKRLRGTYNTSKSAEIMYARLCNIFGATDIEREFVDSYRYPSHVDFYVKSRDMFIELNAFVSHGKHWYNPDDNADCERLSMWQHKADRVSRRSLYHSMIETWAGSDVQKRNMARKHALNYVVFWDVKLRDFDMWVDNGCPDSQDWKYEYEWYGD